jgi:uncharacterized iron-regulated membrane protein
MPTSQARASAHSPKPYVASLRFIRKWHRYLGLALLILLLISALTGILLAWKKQLGWLQPNDKHPIATLPVEQWLSVAALKGLADEAMATQVDSAVRLDRMDVRPNRGMVKMLYQPGNWEVQLQGYTGEVLSVAQRNADWIERLHDGSIVSEPFKLVTMNALGLGLLLIIAGGFWLWLGPRLIRRHKH